MQGISALHDFFYWACDRGVGLAGLVQYLGLASCPRHRASWMTVCHWGLHPVSFVLNALHPESPAGGQVWGSPDVRFYQIRYARNQIANLGRFPVVQLLRACPLLVAYKMRCVKLMGERVLARGCDPEPPDPARHAPDGVLAITPTGVRSSTSVRLNGAAKSCADHFSCAILVKRATQPIRSHAPAPGNNSGTRSQCEVARAHRRHAGRRSRLHAHPPC